MTPAQNNRSAAKDFGEAVKQKRESLEGKPSRAEFVWRFHAHLEKIDPDVKSYDYAEIWLGHLERGEIVRFRELPDSIFDALFTALECTSVERIHLRTIGGLNTIPPHPQDATEAAALLQFGISEIAPEFYAALESLAAHPDLRTSTHEEIKRHVLTTFKVIIDKHLAESG